MRTRLLAGLCVAGCVAGCGTGPLEVSSSPLSGFIDGKAWSFGSAESTPLLSTSEQFFVTAYAEVVAPCTGAGDQVRTNYLLLNVPTATGDYLLGGGLTETFYLQDIGTNYVATQGRIVVNQVSATAVSAGAHFVFDGNNEVNGQFQAQICPP